MEDRLCFLCEEIEIEICSAKIFKDIFLEGVFFFNKFRRNYKFSV